MNKAIYFSILVLFSVLFIETPNASTKSTNFGDVLNELKVVQMGPLDPRRGFEEEDEDQSEKHPLEADE